MNLWLEKYFLFKQGNRGAHLNSNACFQLLHGWNSTHRDWASFELHLKSWLVVPFKTFILVKQRVTKTLYELHFYQLETEFVHFMKSIKIALSNFSGTELFSKVADFWAAASAAESMGTRNFRVKSINWGGFAFLNWSINN